MCWPDSPEVHFQFKVQLWIIKTHVQFVTSWKTTYRICTNYLLVSTDVSHILYTPRKTWAQLLIYSRHSKMKKKYLWPRASLAEVASVVTVLEAVAADEGGRGVRLACPALMMSPPSLATMALAPPSCRKYTCCPVLKILLVNLPWNTIGINKNRVQLSMQVVAS